METKKEHLTHFNIAGFTYYDGVLAFKHLEIGTQLSLKIDNDNRFDARAVAIYYNEHKLGFVPKSENRIIYKFLKIGLNPFDVRVQIIDKKAHPENQIGVLIHLINEI